MSGDNNGGGAPLTKNHLSQIAPVLVEKDRSLSGDKLERPSVMHNVTKLHSKLHQARWVHMHQPLGPLQLVKKIGLCESVLTVEEARELWNADYGDRKGWIEDHLYHLLPPIPPALIPAGEVEVASYREGGSGHDDGTMIHGRLLTLSFARQDSTPQKSAVNGNLRGLRECIERYGMDVNKVCSKRAVSAFLPFSNGLI
jgi:hypothetical protein